MSAPIPNWVYIFSERTSGTLNNIYFLYFLCVQSHIQPSIKINQWFTHQSPLANDDRTSGTIHDMKKLNETQLRDSLKLPTLMTYFVFASTQIYKNIQNIRHLIVQEQMCS